MGPSLKARDEALAVVKTAFDPDGDLPPADTKVPDLQTAHRSRGPGHRVIPALPRRRVSTLEPVFPGAVRVIALPRS
jgi:3-methyladenine DNA glycosylase/8-oxoguanine DNA glycosylase